MVKLWAMPPITRHCPFVVPPFVLSYSTEVTAEAGEGDPENNTNQPKTTVMTATTSPRRFVRTSENVAEVCYGQGGQYPALRSRPSSRAISRAASFLAIA